MKFEDALRSVLRYPEMIVAIAEVLDHGVQKGYPDENWLKPDGKTMSRKANFDSKNHHAASHFAGQSIDKDSRLLHLKHEGTRALMEVVRVERGIVHPDDMPVRGCTIVHKYEESHACKTNQCRCEKVKNE